MNTPLSIKGSSGRQGMFLTGKPQQLILFEDGFVISTAPLSTMFLGGAAGSLINEAITQQAVKKSSSSTLSGEAFAAANKRTEFIPYARVENARLYKGFPERKFEFTVAGKKYLHSYGTVYASAPDDVVIEAMQHSLQERFTNELPH